MSTGFAVLSWIATSLRVDNDSFVVSSLAIMGKRSDSRLDIPTLTIASFSLERDARR
jgi:hypothetical protein